MLILAAVSVMSLSKKNTFFSTLKLKKEKSTQLIIFFPFFSFF